MNEAPDDRAQRAQPEKDGGGHLNSKAPPSAAGLTPPHARTAVHRQRHAGDEAGLVRGQEQGCVGDVPGGTHLLSQWHLGAAIGVFIRPGRMTLARMPYWAFW